MNHLYIKYTFVIIVNILLFKPINFILEIN